MRRIKKMISAMLAVAVMIVMAAAVPVSAAGNGSITIKNATANTNYKVYKIFNATASSSDGTKVAYTVDSDKVSIITSDAPFTVDEEHNVERSSSASDADIITWLSNHYSDFSLVEDVTPTSDGEYTITNLDYGYYYIAAGNGSAISIDTVTPNKNLYIKDTHGPNTPDKKITKEDGVANSGGVTENSADVGSTETFSVTYNATNYVNKTTTTEGTTTTTATKIQNFYIKDTPTGLSIDKSTVKVSVNGEEISNFTKEITDGSLKITIPWVDVDGNSLYSPKANDENADEKYGNIPVTVTYDATVTADAATQVAENEVHIYYNHDGASTSDGPEVTVPGNPPKTTTYTYKFRLNKVDEKNDALSGAQFELYDGANKVGFISEGYIYRVAKADEASTSTTTIDMTTNTTVEILGLDNKEYKLKEIKAPDGYTLASDTTILAADSEANGNKLVRVNGEYGADYGDAGNTAVVNKAGSLLPSTGGIGTTIFYVLGALLIIGAGVVLIARRRMNSNQ